MSQVTIILSPSSIEALIQSLQRGEIARVVGGDSKNEALWLEIVPQKGAMYSGNVWGRLDKNQKQENVIEGAD